MRRSERCPGSADRLLVLIASNGSARKIPV
jgi:hypothetical protein